MSSLGLAGREDSWNYAADTGWYWTLSANEMILAPGEDVNGPLGPALSGQRALGLLVEQFGPERLKRHIDLMATESTS